MSCELDVMCVMDDMALTMDRERFIKGGAPTVRNRCLSYACLVSRAGVYIQFEFIVPLITPLSPQLCQNSLQLVSERSSPVRDAR